MKRSLHKARTLTVRGAVLDAAVHSGQWFSDDVRSFVSTRVSISTLLKVLSAMAVGTHCWFRGPECQTLLVRTHMARATTGVSLHGCASTFAYKSDYKDSTPVHLAIKVFCEHLLQYLCKHNDPVASNNTAVLFT